MKLKAIITILPLICLILAPAILAANLEKITIESLTIRQGEEARVSVRLDSAPNGLAGYEIVVFIEDGEVADILRAEFPEWASLSDSFIEGDLVTLKAVDLEDKIKPGATNINIATVVLGNTRQGESLIRVNVSKMDDDNGNPINPSIEPGKLVVKGATPSGIPLVIPLAVLVVIAATGIAIYLRRAWKLRSREKRSS